MSTSVRDAGSWKTVQNDGLYVRDAGAWKQTQQGYVRDAGVWKQFHQRSDPLYQVFDPVWTNTFGQYHLEQPTTIFGEGPPDTLGSALFQGDWETLGHPSGMNIVHGVVRFDEAAIAAAYGSRKRCTSIEFRVYNRTSYDGAAQAKIWTSTYTGFTNTRPTSIPIYPQRTWVATSPVATDGDFMLTTLPNSVGDGILAGTIKGIILFDDTTTEAGKGLYRFLAGDESSVNLARKPKLIMIADY